MGKKSEEVVGGSFTVEAISLTAEEQNIMVEEILKAKMNGDSYLMNKYFVMLWGSICRLATMILGKSYKHLLADKETKSQVLSMAAAEIFEVLPKYDKTKATFNAFITPYVLHAGITVMSEYNERSNRYEQSAKLISRAAEELTANGREVDINALSIITKLPIKTIYEVVEQNKRLAEVVSLDARDFFSDVYSEDDISDINERRFDNPEEAIVKKEESLKIQEYLDRLDKVTNRIIRLKNGFDTGKPIAEKDIAELLGISIQEIEQRYSAGMRTLARIIKQDPTFTDRAIHQKAENMNRAIQFAPTEVSRTDMEDALSFMMDNEFQLV